MKETTRQIQAVIQRTSPIQLVGVAMGCVLLIAAIVLGGHMIISGKGHGQNEWYFVGGLGLMGGLSIFSEPIIKFVVAVNPFKRNGDKT